MMIRDMDIAELMGVKPLPSFSVRGIVVLLRRCRCTDGFLLARRCRGGEFRYPPLFFSLMVIIGGMGSLIVFMGAAFIWIFPSSQIPAGHGGVEVSAATVEHVNL